MANAFNAYQQAKQGAMQQGAQMLAMEQMAEKVNRERSVRNALSQAYVTPQTGIPMEQGMGPARPAQPGGMDWERAMQGAAEDQVIPEMMQLQAGMRQKTGQLPASLQELRALQGMPEAQKKQFWNIKRGQQIVDIGGVPSAFVPGKGFIPLSNIDQEAEAKRALAASQRIGTEEGKGIGEASSLLKDMESNLPRLKDVVSQLSALGKTATYTKAGQARDYAMRQSGLGVGEGAIARREYIAKVDNEILPLLRQTFGAAFTKAEGDSLKITLGDPDASPEEKDAVLRAFIDSKIEQIKTKKRRVSGTQSGAQKQAGTKPTAPQSAIDYLKTNNNKVVQQQFKAKYGYLP